MPVPNWVRIFHSWQWGGKLTGPVVVFKSYFLYWLLERVQKPSSYSKRELENSPLSIPRAGGVQSGGLTPLRDGRTDYKE